MHLLEAALAWDEAGGGPRWAALADEIMELMLDRFIDHSTGGLLELFDGHWRALANDADRHVEPGHQFEWAWLALRWARKRDRPDAIVAARRLFAIAEAHGICEDRKVAMLELNDDFTPRRRIARLWGQTEWLKAALKMARCSAGAEKEHYHAAALSAVKAMELYLTDTPKGLWRDKLEDTGAFVDEPAPASSLYHIVCAVSELVSACNVAVDS
ncbi:AGE family epimerase/isomerase [Breoghania sp. L-A4]|uniref:AGE family epimerase/isomerase n=1 Tax=Breoghania sp. L-A4 TaxID=2304600 RepID=UPI000E359F05|nr:AGE family epimerase/isomerase [Breoghania sp. L-A4]AXS40642.1 hypothetical protein D1F64_11940 [Breoghania sp. L-A4]